MHERYFEDWAVGDRVDTAAVEVTRDDVLSFARAHDPQPFHLDDAAAAASPFGRIAASGWHTASLAMRLIVESGVFGSTGTVGLGVDDLRWLRPVYPGDRLHVRSACESVRPSSSGASGVVRFAIVTYNQLDEPVMRHTAIVRVPRRPT